MNHTSWRRASFVSSILPIVSLTIAAGCGSKNDSQPSGEAEKPIPLLAGVDAPKPVLNSVDRTDEAGTDALARTTASYADQMEQMLAARAARSAQAVSEAAATAALAPAETADNPIVSNEPAAIAPEPQPSGAAAEPSPPAPSQVEFADSAALPPVDEPLVATPPAAAEPQVRTVARTNEVRTPSPVPPPTATQQPAEQLAANIAGPAVPQLAPAGVAGEESALQQKFTQRIKDYPRDVAAHLDYQLLQFVKDQSVPDLNAIASLPAEDRELVTALVDGLSNFRNTVRADNNTLLSKKVAPIVAMADRLRASANLSIPTVALCTSVQQFGVYAPVESSRFKAGVDNQVILYCEVANFASHLNGSGMWETKLTYETTLYTDDDAGLSVWQGKPTPIADQCRNRRHDFFLADRISLPANLPVGRYLMKVSIVDQHANRIAEATVPLQLVIVP